MFQNIWSEGKIIVILHPQTGPIAQLVRAPDS